MQMEFKWVGSTDDEPKAPWFKTHETRGSAEQTETLWARSMANSIELNLNEVLDDAARGQEDPYLANLARWQTITRLQGKLGPLENELRKQLFAGAFPDPKEGMNNHTLPDGRIIKGTHKINRNVDQAAVPSAIRQLREDLGAKVDDLFPTKFSLSKKVLDSLTPEQKKIAATAYVEKPGTPALEIV